MSMLQKLSLFDVQQTNRNLIFTFDIIKDIKRKAFISIFCITTWERQKLNAAKEKFQQIFLWYD